MALTDYSIDTTDYGLDPKNIERKRLLAQALQKQGSDYSPVASPWQGLARVGNELAGVLQERKLDQQDKAGRASANSAFAAYPGGTTPASQAAATSGTPLGNALTGPPPADTTGKIYSNDEPSPLDPPSGADRQKMLATILGEEATPQGQAGVANVIRNRAVDGGYGGDTPSAVVQAPNQFEPWNTPAGKARMAAALQNPTQVAAADNAIKQAYGEGGKAPEDPTEGKTMFYAPDAQAALGRPAPSWAQGPGQMLGKTAFFDDNSEMPKNAQPAQGQLPVQQGPQVAQNGGGGADVRAWALGVLQNPRSTPIQQQVAKEALTSANKPPTLVNAGGGKLYDPASKTWITAPETEEDAGKVKSLTPGGELYHMKDGKVIVDHKNDKSVNAEDVPQATIDFLADRVRMGDPAVKIGYARNPGVIAKIDSTAQQREDAGIPVSDAARNVVGNKVTLSARGSAERKLGTINTNNEFFGNNALGALDIAEKASATVPRTNYPGVNKALNAYRSNTGDPKTVALGAALNTVVNDYAKFTGGGVGSDSLRGHAEAILNGAHSHEQLQAIVHMMRTEIKRGQQSPGMVREGFDSLYAPHGSAIAPKADAASAPAAPATSGPQDGDTAHNPTTGETIIRKDGKWVPAS